jgi:dynein light chain LC8-type
VSSWSDVSRSRTAALGRRDAPFLAPEHSRRSSRAIRDEPCPRPGSVSSPDAAPRLTAFPPARTQALEKYNIEKDIAAFIKKEFDKKYNPTWHCIVGRNFGSYVTHETKHFIYFYLGQVAVLLFKSG